MTFTPATTPTTVRGGETTTVSTDVAAQDLLQELLGELKLMNFYLASMSGVGAIEEPPTG